MSNIRTLDQRNPVAAHIMEARQNISSLRHIGIEHGKTPRRGEILIIYEKITVLDPPFVYHVS